MEDEFKFTREFNQKFRERCEEKDKEALEKKKEIMKEAQEELEKWREERAKKLAAKAEMNRQEEEKICKRKHLTHRISEQAKLQQRYRQARRTF